MLGSPCAGPTRRRRAVVGLGLAGVVASTLVATAATSPTANADPAASRAGTGDWRTCAAGSPGRQAAFGRAAAASGVPRAVLLGVSYLESRWDDHGTAPSTSGGYGPMHLTAVTSTPAPLPDPLGKGEGDDRAATVESSRADASRLRTLDRAADLTGLAPERLRSDAAANVCGGAALLAAYQDASGVAPDDLSAWSAGIARYSGAYDEATALRFTRQVLGVVRDGAARTTNDGQRVRLAAHPVRLDRDAVAALGLSTISADAPTAAAPGSDCTAALDCTWMPAPYEQYGEDASAYGNHDLADRPHDLDLDTIVIHDTEATWDRTLSLVSDPTYVSWHYSLRSSDGKIAQHVPVGDVAWHAGNWYTNMHSIGLEHEGFAAEGASWYTEALYRSSARLVRHLAATYDIPLDRAHVVGHDQVPGIDPEHVATMHWDPGPYWDWEHYFDLLGAPINGAGPPVTGRDRPTMVTVAPGFEQNRRRVTGCTDEGTCERQGTNFVYLRQAPRNSAPLVRDVGLHPDGEASTTEVSDIGARAAAGQRFAVARYHGSWLGVWWLGHLAWLRSPASAPTVVADDGPVVVPRRAEVPVYGRAYPEESAYPAAIDYQPVVPLQYTMQRGQAYVIADRTPETDYYWAKTYGCQGSETVRRDCTEVVGEDRYLQVWFGHRMAYVRAADVRIVPAAR